MIYTVGIYKRILSGLASSKIIEENLGIGIADTGLRVPCQGNFYSGFLELNILDSKAQESGYLIYGASSLC